MLLIDDTDHPVFTRQHDLWTTQIMQTGDLSSLKHTDHE